MLFCLAIGLVFHLIDVTVANRLIWVFFRYHQLNCVVILIGFKHAGFCTSKLPKILISRTAAENTDKRDLLYLKGGNIETIFHSKNSPDT